MSGTETNETPNSAELDNTPLSMSQFNMFVATLERFLNDRVAENIYLHASLKVVADRAGITLDESFHADVDEATAELVRHLKGEAGGAPEEEVELDV